MPWKVLWSSFVSYGSLQSCFKGVYIAIIKMVGNNKFLQVKMHANRSLKDCDNNITDQSLNSNVDGQLAQAFLHLLRYRLLGVWICLDLENLLPASFVSTENPFAPAQSHGAIFYPLLLYILYVRITLRKHKRGGLTEEGYCDGGIIEMQNGTRWKVTTDRQLGYNKEKQVNRCRKSWWLFS